MLEELQTPILDENENEVSARADARNYYSYSSNIRGTDLVSGINLDNKGIIVLMLTALEEKEAKGTLEEKDARMPNYSNK